MLALCREATDDGVGELFPAFALVRCCLMGTYRKGGVQEEHALRCPALETTTRWDGYAEVVLYFLKYIDERRRYADAVLDRETQPFSLTGSVIGVLTYNNDLDLIEWAKVEGIEYFVSRWIAHALCILRAHKVGELFEIRGFELRAELLVPCGVYLDVHEHKITTFRGYKGDMGLNTRDSCRLFVDLYAESLLSSDCPLLVYTGARMEMYENVKLVEK